MSGFTLRARATPALRLDLRGLTPQALAGLSAAEASRLPLAHGRAMVPAGEFFDLQPRDDGALVFAADLARCDRVGWRMGSGRLVVEGGVGELAGGAMTGGELHVHGSAGDMAACEMAGGRFTIDGDAGDFVGGTLPGSMDGMRGGTLVVRGSVGARCADRMRRGTLVVHGDSGDFPASRMVAGTLALAGRAGRHLAYGMRRGSVVLAGPPSGLPPGFVPAGGEAPVFWQLLARELARQGGAFAALASRGIVRHLGDLAVDGRGEVILVQ